MLNDVWFNLPVADAVKSRVFFEAVGFRINTKYAAPNSTSLMVGRKDVIIMLFETAVFKTFTKNEVVTGPDRSEMIISFDCESKSEVDETASKVKAAGGSIYAQPQDMQGWMYGFAFSDLDGHKWNMLYMDYSKLPK